MQTATTPDLDRLAEAADAREAEWSHAARRLRNLKMARNRAWLDLDAPPSRGMPRWSRLTDLVIQQDKRVRVLKGRLAAAEVAFSDALAFGS